MNALHRIRRCSGTLARVNAALFALVWLAFVATPCVMAMQQAEPPEAEHVCPHCLPEPCHEVAAQDCDAPDLLDALRFGDQAKTMALAPPPAASVAMVPTIRAATPAITSHPPSRAGPRPHLLHAQFNE